MSELDIRRPFTYQQAIAAGISAGALKRPARFRRLFRGVYVAAGVGVSTSLRAQAALLLHPPRAFISHTTSATLQGITVPIDPQVHVTVPLERFRRRRSGISTHVRGAATVLTTADGLRLSVGPELFVELAQLLTLMDLVIAGDALVAQQRIKPHQLVDSPGCGAGPAREAAVLVRERVESPMETRVRLLVLWAGFPEPEVNLAIGKGAGSYRLDLCWPELRLAVEYDGQQHRTDMDQWDSDIRRRESLQRSGWTIVTLVARDVYRRPAAALDRIFAAWMACGGARFVMSDDWRPHFGGERAA